jgi:sporulation protein YlmC with PRC-barrel domain
MNMNTTNQQEYHMQTKIRLATWVAVILIHFGVSLAQAEPERLKQFSAGEILGMKVMNAQNEDLGKVQDLIVNFDSGSVPFAVIGSGLASRTKIAVPLDSLSCSSDGKHFTLNATKEELKTASKSPQGRWVIAENAEWTKSIDGYYGQPTATWRDKLFRQPLGEGDTRVYTRDPVPKGAERLMQPADAALCEKICSAIDGVNVEVENGVARLSGTVASEEARQSTEAKARAVPGVQRVESNLKVKKP